MYIKRTIEPVIHHMSGFFPVVLITGPRQVGKTTVFKTVDMGQRTYVSLDSLTNRDLAQNDPVLFLQRFAPPVLIDEVQYARQLFPHIKDIVDSNGESGAYWLTGSQQFELMQNVSESLAGRVGILKLQGLSQQEKNGNSFVKPFIPTAEWTEMVAQTASETHVSKIFYNIWMGTYPKLHIGGDAYWENFYESYVQTYIEKDIWELTNISNAMNFLRFMKAVAARTAQVLNYADIAKDIGVSQPTVKAWVSILQTSGVIYLLYPYSNNRINRAVKTPKVYFMDTGLVAYLTGWKTAEVLENGAMNGAFLETYIVAEILKGYWHNGTSPNMFFYRDKDGKEIDIILEQNNILYPIEVKKKTNPNKGDIKNFAILEKFGKDIGTGAILCLAKTHLPITDKVTAVPIGYL